MCQLIRHLTVKVRQDVIESVGTRKCLKKQLEEDSDSSLEHRGHDSVTLEAHILGGSVNMTQPDND